MSEYADHPIPLLAKAYDRCVPLFVTIELSLRCNLRCVHCYNFDREQPLEHDALAQELSPAEIYQVIDAVHAEGALEIAFTGGESLLHPHLDEFIRYARARMIGVRIKSNGMALTPERAKRLMEAGVAAVDISLYGASPATHDAFTRLPGSFDKTIAGIEAAVAAGLRVSLSFCLTRHNAPEIAEMLAIAERHGVTFSLDSQLTARYDGTTSSLDHRVDAETLEALYRGPLGHLLDTGRCVPQREMNCSCARTVVGISATGEVYPCIGAPMPSGNLREAPFSEIWRGSPVLNRVRGLTLPDFKDCAGCPDRPFCRRSSGAVYVNTGDYTGAEPWTCMEAALLHRMYDEAQARGESLPSYP
ncbi:MAG TPA: radical SAM protein [Oscillatoriaceae cyanobacterium]